MNGRHRIHRALVIEELEPRVAPVILSIGGTTNYPFTDSEGNNVDVTLSGSVGSLEILDSSSEDPNGTDIATINYSVSDPTTTLTITVTGGSGDGITSAGDVDASGLAFGTLSGDVDLNSLTAASIWNVDIAGNLTGNVTATGSSGGIYRLTVGGNIASGAIVSAPNSGISTSYYYNGQWCGVTVGGTINGRVETDFGSAFRWWEQGQANSISLSGTVSTPNAVTIDGSYGLSPDNTAYADMTLNNADLSLYTHGVDFRNVTAPSIANWYGYLNTQYTRSSIYGTLTLNTFASSPSLTLGDLNNFTISTGDLGGNLTLFHDLTGTVQMPGDLTGNVAVQGRMWGLLDVDGNFTGSFTSPRSLYGGGIQVTGNMVGAEIDIGGSLSGSVIEAASMSGGHIQATGDLYGTVRTTSGDMGTPISAQGISNVEVANNLTANVTATGSTIGIYRLNVANDIASGAVVSAPNSVISTSYYYNGQWCGVTVGGTIDGRVETDFGGVFRWWEQAYCNSICLTGALSSPNSLIIDGSFGVSPDNTAYADMTLNNADLSLYTYGVDFRNVTASSIGTWYTYPYSQYTKSSIYGTLTLGTYGSSTSLTLGNLENLTVSTGDLAGQLRLFDDLRGKISAPNGIIEPDAIDVDGIIDASQGGEIEIRLLAGDTSFSYDEGPDTKTFNLVGLAGSGQQGTLTVGGAAGQEGDNPANEARANLTLNEDATSLTTSNIIFKDMTVPNVTTINIGSAIEGTLTMTSFAPGDSVTISGNLHDFTLTTGDFAGTLDVGASITGNLTVSSGNIMGVWDGFAAAVNYPAGEEPHSVAIGDLDGDFNLDLAVANSQTHNVSVLLGNGDGTFKAAAYYAAGNGARSVAIGDLDGDSYLDLAVANYHDDNVSVHLGNGDGTFKAAAHYAAGEEPRSVAIGDLDGDSHLDLAVANSWTHNVSVLLGNGDGTFAAQVTYGAGSMARSLAIGDLDGDSHLDLAVANEGSNNVSVLLGNGDGTFAAQVTYAAGGDPYSVAISDLDADSYLDLAVANEYSANVSVLLGKGDGTFAAQATYAAGDYPSSVAIGDLNGDFVLDLAVANLDGNASVLLGNGDGTFGAPVNYGVGSYPYSVAIGDVNGDSILDLTVANGGTNNVSVLLGRVNPSILLRSDLQGKISAPNAMIAGRAIDVDGIIDASKGGEIERRLLAGDTRFGYDEGPDTKAFTLIGLAGSDQQGTLTIGGAAGQEGDIGTNEARANLTLSENATSLATSNITFKDMTVQNIARTHIASKVEGTLTMTYFGGGDLVTISGDLNNFTLTTGDLAGTLAVGGSITGDLTVSSGDIGGRFQAAVNYAAGSKPRSVAIDYLNNDPYLDLAVANEGSHNVSILLGNGDGTFASQVTYAAGNWPSSVAMGDLNGDSYLDLAVANLDNNVSVLLGNGDGTFGAAQNYGAGPYAYSVAIGYLNDDSYLDLAVANANGDNVSVLLGNGDGTFASQLTYAAKVWPRSVAMGDLNDDPYLDLAVANEGSQNVSILLGNGDGTFASQVTYAAGDYPSSVAIGYLNGGSYLDLAVSNYNSHNVSILLGNGDGTFASQVTYAAGDHPSSVAIGDLNGDSYLDLAVSNYNSHNVSILLGNGDGTFAPQMTYGAGAVPSSVAMGDLNDDSILDLAVPNYKSHNVSVLLAGARGSILVANDVQGKVSAPNGVIASGVIDIDGIIDASNGGEIERRMLAGDTHFTYEEGPDTKTFDLVGLSGSVQQGTLTIGGAAGQEGDNPANEARANLTLNAHATSVTTSNINFKDMNVQSITLINIANDVEGTLTMASFSDGDWVTVSGDLNNFTLTTGDMAGFLNVGDDLTGLINIAGKLTGDGGIIIANDLEPAGQIYIGGKVDSIMYGGAIQIGGSVLTTTGAYSIKVVGALDSIIDIAGNADTGNRIELGSMTASAQLLAAVFGNVEIFGDFLGTIGDAGTTNGTGNTLGLHPLSGTINGQVYRDPDGLISVTGAIPSFNGAFAAIDDLDV